MKDIIQKKYLIAWILLLFISYSILSFNSEVIGSLIGISYPLSSDLCFYLFTVIILISLNYTERLRIALVEGSNYHRLNYRASKTRMIYGGLAILSLIIYGVLSMRSTFSPLFILVITIMLIKEVFWNHVYMNDEMIVLQNTVIQLDEIISYEKVTDEMGKKLKFEIDGYWMRVSFVTKRVQEAVMAHIEAHNAH